MTQHDHPSTGNPCPVLRGLVSEGLISEDHEPARHVSGVIADLFPPQTPSTPVRAAIAGIATIGNGLSPRSLASNLRSGLRPSELRGGPLDKRGAGSRILDQSGRFDEEQFARLDEFAVDCLDIVTGETERGLGEEQLVAMMDANAERAKSFRRPVDRRLMDGEWPILLKVLGKKGQDGLYLSLDEVRDLFADDVLPDRVLARRRDRA